MLIDDRILINDDIINLLALNMMLNAQIFTLILVKD